MGFFSFFKNEHNIGGESEQTISLIAQWERTHFVSNGYYTGNQTYAFSIFTTDSKTKINLADLKAPASHRSDSDSILGNP